MTIQNKEDGFSLVEIIVSMSLLLMLFALLVLESRTLLQSKGQRYENIAYHLASKQMEELRLTPISDLADSGGISNSLLDEIPAGEGSYTVTDYPDHDGLKEIVVTVTWNNGANSAELRTIAGGNGLNSQEP